MSEIQPDRKFTVPGEPRGKGRPRFSSHGKFSVAYTDDKTASYENLVALAYREANPNAKPMEGQVGIQFTAYFPFTKKYYWPTNKKHHGELRPEGIKALENADGPITKPDTDNILKALLDGLNIAGAWRDDSQVTVINGAKEFTDRNPRLEVTLWDASVGPKAD